MNNNNHNHNHSQQRGGSFTFALASPISNTATTSSHITTNINVPPPLDPPSSSSSSYQPPPIFATAPPITFLTRTGNTYKKSEHNQHRRSIIRTAYFTPLYRDDENKEHVAEHHRCNFCLKEGINKHTQQIVNHLLGCSKASAEAKSMLFFCYFFL